MRYPSLAASNFAEALASLNNSSTSSTSTEVIISRPDVCAIIRAGVNICTAYRRDVRAPISPKVAKASSSVSILSV